MDEHRENGEWWQRGLWSGESRTVYCPYPQDDIEAAIESLKSHFDAEWAVDLAQNPRPNRIYAMLALDNSTAAIGFVIYLGQMVTALAGAAGFNRILTDLKGAKSTSALFECEAAYAFASADCEVRFPAEGSAKSPDAMVTLADTLIAIECKRLRDEAWEDWEFLLTSRIISGLPTAKEGREINAGVTLNTKLTQVFMDTSQKSLNHAFVDAIVEEVVATTHRAVNQRSIPFEIEIGELAQAAFRYKDAGDYSAVSGMPRASPPITRRILQNGVIPACQQLPSEYPGIVFVYHRVLPDAAFFNLLFQAACRAAPERFGALVVVILCPVQTIFLSQAPLVFVNPESAHVDCRDKVLAILERHFGCAPVHDDDAGG